MRWGRAQAARTVGLWLAGAVVATVAFGGCDTAPDPEAPPSSVLNAPTHASVSAQPERDAVVAAYDQFWDRMHTVPHDPESTWDDAMAEVAVNPQLKITLQGMRLAKERGVTSYGTVTSRITDVDIDGDEATVMDCQDASESGQADATSGEKKTVGVKRNPVEARLHRDNGRWKVAEISYPGGEC